MVLFPRNPLVGDESIIVSSNALTMCFNEYPERPNSDISSSFFLLRNLVGTYNLLE